MDTQDQRGGTFFGRLPAVVAAMIAAIIAGFTLAPAPIPDSGRPPGDPSSESKPLSNISKRLWEDPLYAPGDKIDTSSLPLCSETLNSAGSWQYAEPPSGASGPSTEKVDTLPLIVIAGGGEYAEDIERRIRARTAVLSGLHRWGYDPLTPEALGLCRVRDTGTKVAETADKRPSQGKSEFENIATYELFQLYIDDTARIKGSSIAQTTYKNRANRVLVLWLSDNFLKWPFNTTNMAITYTDSIKDIIGRNSLPGDQSAKPIPVVLGPLNHDMASTLKVALETYTPESSQDGYRIYWPFKLTSSITVPSRLGAGGEKQIPDGTSAPLQIFEFGQPDEKLAGAAIGELGTHKLRLTTIQHPEAINREIKSSDLHWNSCLFDDHIALLNEWDTPYARDFRRAFVNNLASESGQKTAELRDRDVANLHGFAFTRGLDGKALTTEKKTEKPGGDATRAKVGKNGEYADSDYEHARGTSQRDYLRRMADQISDRDTALKRICGRSNIGIKSIGILASDFHDKLMLLKTLKQRFPTAVFFTTELDARLLEPANIAETRNLVVISHFGLALAPPIQRFIIPFRDSQQTSLFLATSFALLHATNRNVDEMSREMGQWSGLEPRIYEIGLSNIYSLSAPPGKCIARESTEYPSNLLDCQDIHPPRPSIDGAGLFSIACKLIAAGFFLYILSIIIWAPEDKWTFSIVAIAGFMALVLPIMVFGLMVGQTNFPQQEPFAWADGVSMWPSLWIRWLSLLLGLFFLYFSSQKTSKALRAATKRLQLPSISSCKQLQVNFWQEVRDDFKSAGQVLYYRLHTGFLGRPKAGQFPASQAKVHWQYFERGVNPGVQLVIGTPWALLIIVLLFHLFYSQSRLLPMRGEYAMQSLMVVGTLSVFILLLLIFMSLSIALRIKRLAIHLADYRCRWPQETVDAAARHLSSRIQCGLDVCQIKRLANSGLKRKIFRETIDHYVDIRVLADVSRGGRWFLYFPAIILAMMIAARWTKFDAWPVDSLTIFIYGSFGLSTALSVWVVVDAAKFSRANALERLESVLLTTVEAKDGKTLPASPSSTKPLAKLSWRKFAGFPFTPKAKATLQPPAQAKDIDPLIRFIRYTIDDIKREKHGIFQASFVQFIQAVMIPLISAGGLELWERLSAGGW